MDGLLIVNLGTPKSPEVVDVRTYLNEFLMDPFVLDMPFIKRWLLLNLIVLRTRPQKNSRSISADLDG